MELFMGTFFSYGGNSYQGGAQEKFENMLTPIGESQRRLSDARSTESVKLAVKETETLKEFKRGGCQFLRVLRKLAPGR
ncbi:hypothetical protein E4U54_005910 [Claviceps lovelessii]|nr:hypothetical protein E4U54_005910 [Claviceps lovelessii]